MKQLACILFLAAGSHAIASVTGTIVDDDGEGLADCVVRSDELESRSAADGSFSIDSNGPGRLRIDCRGYAPRFIDLDAGVTSLGRITLKRPGRGYENCAA